MKFCFLTLFPQLIESYFSDSILKRALEKGLIDFEILNIRDYAYDKYKKTDEPPISGGAGQVIKADVLGRALQDVKDTHIIFLSPCGKPFNNDDALRLSKKSRIAFVCGRYEGFDERVIECFGDEVMSVGDFIVTGGELPALMMCDSIARQIKGVLGNEDSLKQESFEDFLLEAPNFAKISSKNTIFFTPPSEYSKGNHSKIADLKKCLAICKTKYFRPDLYQKYRTIVHQQKIKEKGKK